MTELSLAVPPKVASDTNELKKVVGEKLNVSPDNLFVYVRKRSIDARQRNVLIQLQLIVTVDKPYLKPPVEFNFNDVSQSEPIHIIGAGPAGYFAALKCILSGRKPIIFERGKSVRERRRDLALITRQGFVNPESNYCFGEGGAGTYSDGKLYTRSSKRGSVEEILNLLVEFGADPSILIDAHPHIGTNKLPSIIENIRSFIIQCGGEVYFNSKLTAIHHSFNRVVSIEINHSMTVNVLSLILATGHSARDIFELLHRSGILIESKPFALGVRVEHPQRLIDEMQYHSSERSIYLPPSSYSYALQVNGRGFYSFCMCPGGIIAPCATDVNEVVTNGWSPSKRNNPFANSGMVVEVRQEDFKNKSNTDPFVMLDFQRDVERNAFMYGGGKLVAPAQRLVDLTLNKVSSTLPDCSYLPGITSIDLKEVLPTFIHHTIKNGLLELKKKMPFYFTNEAVLVATESRTSSPVRIPRDSLKLHHPQLHNLYPCAEGAGYAGGIVSAAIDGFRCVSSVVNQFINE
jgi:uncharacterized FAD-dependent dehydrogenase